MSATPDPARIVSGRPLPSGTVTFAFTDIEGSTVRWEREPEAMRDALRRHDALLRAAIVDNGGYVFKTVGDAFCAAFARPHDAVAAMLAAQVALAAEDFEAVDGLRIRAAIHTGIADERDGDYFGPAVNRVARLLAIAHGGQTLVSGVTGDLLHGALPPRAGLRALGEHRLKDLARPENVYQLVASGLRLDFPPLRSIDASPNNLPASRTSFVGRDAEIAEIVALARTNRLVTLIGSGGIGKTRASLQAAAELLHGSRDGVWFVELAPLANGEYLPTTIASLLGVASTADGDPLGTLVRALEEKQALLVLDNCEHLLEPAARAVSELLKGCSKLKILASSRQALGIAGEVSFRMPSLGVPTEAEAPHITPADAAKYSAMTLFAERARAVDRRFAIGDENAPIVADICRRLDGIPLAVELAAARVNILTPRQLRQRLDERFRVLTGGSRDALPRQQTLRALIDWSHDLLDDRERALFRRLAIFVNGFTIEAATTVGSAEGLDELDAFDVLSSLVDKSLVLAELHGDVPRYRFLESTRAFALEKLEAANEREALAARHLRYFAETFAKLRSLVEETVESAKLIAAMQVEREDVRSALDGALGRGDVVCGAELLGAVDRSWVAIGFLAAGTSLCERYLAALPAGEARLRACVGTQLAFLLAVSGRATGAREASLEAEAQGRASGDSRTLAYALLLRSSRDAFAQRLDDAEAALVEVEASPDLSARLRIGVLDARANLSFLRGDFESAASTYERLRLEFHALGNTRNELIASMNLADTEHVRGRTERAIAIMHEIVPAARAGTDTILRTNVLQNFAGYLVAAGELSGAASMAREALVQCETDPDDLHAAIALEHLALVFALRGDLARAATLASYAGAALLRIGYEREHSERVTHERLCALFDGLAPDVLERSSAEAAALSPAAAFDLALRDP